MRRKLLSALIACTAVTGAFGQGEPGFKRLTGVVDGYPSLSPDGKKILFDSDRSGNSELYVMDLDGNNLKRLTNSPEHDNSPKWSPDGKQIVFARDLAENSEIFIINADGSNERRLTQVPGDDSHPNFSPDGKKIIFNSARTSPDLKIEWRLQFHEVFIMNIDGSDVRQISTFKIVSTYPSISPDGTKICFRRVTNDPGFNYDLTVGKRNSEVFVMNIDGSNPINISNSPAYDGWPTWTPDGKVIFSSNRGGIPYSAQLYQVNVDGSDLKLVSDPKYSLIQATVGRDGRMIYCQHSLENDGYDNGGLASIELK
jgi:Tol biopolymer transport system component